MPYHKSLNDNDLAAMLKSGNEDAAFVEIYERYWQKLYIIARNRLNDVCDAEEIVQDIFCNLWRNRNSFTLEKSFDHYFSVAVKYGVINKLARKARKITFEKNAEHNGSFADHSTLQHLELAELRQQIKLQLRSLPEKCQTVFDLKYEKDYSQRHIAEELSISEKTVEAHLSRARKLLKSRIIYILYLLLLFSI